MPKFSLSKLYFYWKISHLKYREVLCCMTNSKYFRILWKLKITFFFPFFCKSKKKNWNFKSRFQVTPVWPDNYTIDQCAYFISTLCTEKSFHMKWDSNYKFKRSIHTITCIQLFEIGDTVFLVLYTIYVLWDVKTIFFVNKWVKIF